MNLLKPDLWTTEHKFGNTSPDSMCAFHPDMTQWADGQMILNNRKEVSPGWYMKVPGWIKTDCLKDYRAARQVSVQQFQFGTFDIVFRLPNFRGSWPAIWLIGDTVPPEIDIMEHFFKSFCIDRYKTTHTYHDLSDGSEYSKIIACKANWQGFDVTGRDMRIKFIWDPGKLTWMVNDKTVLVVLPSQCKEFPKRPMNLIINSGVGDWNVQDDKLEPFIIKKLEYLP